MYDELVKRLRELASIPEHCENVADCDECSKEDICLSFTNKRIIDVTTQAADAIEELILTAESYKRSMEVRSVFPRAAEGGSKMSVIIKGMEMPTTGLYFVSVDNTGGRDKTVVTVERMLGNRDVRQIVGSFELVPVPEHWRLIDMDALAEHKFVCIPHISIDGKEAGTAYRLGWNTAIEAVMENAETIIGGE